MKVKIEKKMEIILDIVARDEDGRVHGLEDLPKDVVALLIDDWVRRMRVKYGLNDSDHAMEPFDEIEQTDIADYVKLKLQPSDEKYPPNIPDYDNLARAMRDELELGELMRIDGRVYMVVPK